MGEPQTGNLFRKKFLANHNLITFPKRSSRDSLIRDLTPYFQISRFFGISPYLISNTNFTFSKYVLTYSVIYFICLTYIFAVRFHIYTNFNEKGKLGKLILARIVSFYISGMVDFIVSTLYSRNLQKALLDLKLYDMTMKFRSKENNSFVKWSWFVITIDIAINLLLTGCLHLLRGQIMFTFYVFVVSLRTSLSILKFLGLVMSIFIRLRHLNLTLMKGL